MRATGPIFLVLVVSCLFYLVPRRLMWRIPTQAQVDEKAKVKPAIKTVHMGTALPAPVELAEVSTNLTRHAARRASFRFARQAQALRKGVLIIVAIVTAATIPFAVLGMMHWWICVTGGVLTIGWAVFSQIEARRMMRQLDAIIADDQLSDLEETVAVVLPEKAAPKDLPAGAVLGPNGDVQQSLWDPLTVVGGSYISAPKAARTVRTIKLAPLSSVPVTADGTEESSGRIAI